jgi:pimeloyl-ACP methyl ester carboxylesterase
MTSLDRDVAQLKFVELAGYRMAYREWGDTTATQAVILVHGITSSSLSWIRVGPRLADHNIHRGRFDAFMTEVEPFLATT